MLLHFEANCLKSQTVDILPLHPGKYVESIGKSSTPPRPVNVLDFR